MATTRRCRDGGLPLAEQKKSHLSRKDNQMYNSKETDEFAPCSASSYGETRRVVVSIVGSLISSAAIAGVHPMHVLAAGGMATASSMTGVTSSSSPTSTISPSEAQVTHKVFMNVRISRSDGTFYVRDDLPDTPENRVFDGRLVLGLFGKNCPTHVEKFLSYVTNKNDPLDDNPLPSYSRSYFTSFDQASGVLIGGMIPSLELTDINGNTAIRYGGRLLPASLWVERGKDSNNNPLPPPISHIGKGLLTHRLLDATPAFGVTTRSDTTQLDRTHVVFGKILFDASTSGTEFIETVQELPTYAVDRPASSSVNDDSVVEEAAEAVYNAQRIFFRNAAKTLGDTRLGKVYEGKLLRRVEVTQVGLL